jgi:hypothetical protein
VFALTPAIGRDTVGRVRRGLAREHEGWSRRRIAPPAAVLLALGLATTAIAGSDVTIESDPEGSGNGLVYRSANDPSVANAGTSIIVATCPTGRVLTGGGLLVSGSSAEAAIVDMGPNRSQDVGLPAKTAWTGIIGNTGGAKSVTSYAICAAPRGIRLRRDADTTTADDQAVTLTARCGRRASVTGGGFHSDSNIDDRVHASAPFDGGDRGRKPDDGWRVHMTVAQASREVVATAICRRGKRARKRIAYRSDRHNASGDVNETAFCPSGAAVLGGGGSLSGSGGHLNSAYPYAAEDPPMDSWSVYTYSAITRTTAAYVICKRG